MSYILNSTIDHSHWKYRQWLSESSSEEILKQANELVLRRDMITLLAYVRDHRVIGTKSTGNMPLAAIREVAASFANPPALDTQIGNNVYKLRTEFDAWPIYFLHILAQIGELLDTPMGARWRLTPGGTTFLGFASLDQVLHMLYVWWFRINWAIACPRSVIGEYVPKDLPAITLNRLQSTPVGRHVEFVSFADALIKRTGLNSNISDTDFGQRSLRWAVRKMIVEVAEGFGIMTTETQECAPFLAPNLLAFRMTPFGRLLLTALELLSDELRE